MIKAKDSVHVMKLGGSLLDLPDVVSRLERYREEHVNGRALLVVGGGRSADTVRHFDRHTELGEKAGHWLAVRAMGLNAHILAAVVEGARLVGSREAAEAVWAAGELGIVEPIKWLEADELAGSGVPHTWEFTSDSIAAHVARRVEARRLTLFKSVSASKAMTLDDAAAAGWVDGCFAQASRGIQRVEMVNFRADPSAAVVLG